MSKFSGHQRNCSQAQQLISNEECEPSTASPYDSEIIIERNENRPLASYSGGGRPDAVYQPFAPNGNALRFSTLSDCSSSYYGLAGDELERRVPGEPNQHLCNNPYIRANMRVVVGSAALTLVGAFLLLFGVCVMVFPNEMDIHGWIFLVVGTLFFIPGFYHVVYIGCTLCSRPGYSFDNLPTFSKP